MTVWSGCSGIVPTVQTHREKTTPKDAVSKAGTQNCNWGTTCEQPLMVPEGTGPLPVHFLFSPKNWGGGRGEKSTARSADQ